MRRDILVAIPVLGLGIIVQTAIIGRITLLNGQADLLLLILTAWSLQDRVRSAWIWGLAAGLLVGLISGVQWFIYPLGYLLVVGMGRLLGHHVWQAPLLAMFTVTFIGTILLLMLTYVERSLFAVPLSFNQSFVRIILPSILLNMLLSIPVHGLMRELVNLLYPAEAGA
jgi:cell shape-determining protein MreD